MAAAGTAAAGAPGATRKDYVGAAVRQLFRPRDIQQALSVEQSLGHGQQFPEATDDLKDRTSALACGC